jgi:hypothetical protein
MSHVTRHTYTTAANAARTTCCRASAVTNRIRLSLKRSCANKTKQNSLIPTTHYRASNFTCAAAACALRETNRVTIEHRVHCEERVVIQWEVRLERWRHECWCPGGCQLAEEKMRWKTARENHTKRHTSHVTRSITCMLRRSSCKPATACSSRSAVPPRALSQRTPAPLMPRPQVCCSPPPVSV